jgi:hypothetical protein
MLREPFPTAISLFDISLAIDRSQLWMRDDQQHRARSQRKINGTMLREIGRRLRPSSRAARADGNIH